MKADELHEEVRDELKSMGRVVAELKALAADVEGRAPTLREKAAAGGFLSSFYMGVENILKRISRYENVALPRSARWHVELLEQFAPPPHETLPVLFNEELLAMLDPYRRFRHVVHHGYGLDLDWALMQNGVANVEPVFERIRERVAAYPDDLPERGAA